jgi:hypothetical protein
LKPLDLEGSVIVVWETMAPGIVNISQK